MNAILKDPQYVNQKMRDCARGQPCQIQADVCTGDEATSVWCHSNLQIHGRGYAHKSHDCFGVIGCYACHQWLDYGPADSEEKREVFENALRRTQLHCWRTGIFKVA